jgi:hypothetical protein
MPELTPADEGLVHQIPEPLVHTGGHHEHWRESYFFVAHPPDDGGRGGAPDDDVVILTLATYPQHQAMDSYQMGRIDGQHMFAIHQRPWDDDPHTPVAGPVRIEVLEPYQSVRLVVDDVPAAVTSLDLTFTARTEPYALRRGTMRWRDDVVWDQSHMFQAGVFDGTYTRDGVTRTMDGWWGQRDHSWGIRDHVRCPMWMWLALQFDDEMVGVWHWEYANGAPVYTDGCAAPSLASGGGPPVPVVRFDHDLHWTGVDGRPVDYGRDGLSVAGLAGRVSVVLADGRQLDIEGEGERAAPYGDRGGGQYLMRLRTGDGRTGTGVIEVTGAHHHRFFPVARGDRLPPG